MWFLVFNSKIRKGEDFDERSHIIYGCPDGPKMCLDRSSRELHKTCMSGRLMDVSGRDFHRVPIFLHVQMAY